jgi:PleD family two-component response regulator
VSIGISSFPQNGRSIDEMIENAEAALYKAKSMGKDVTVIYGD